MNIVSPRRPNILEERERIEAGRRVPETLARDLARAGFFRIFLPAAYGGLDLTPIEAMEVYEELARADASVAWCVWNGNVNWTTARLSKDVAGAIFADPDMILANSTRPRARLRAPSWRPNGERWSAVTLLEAARAFRPRSAARTLVQSAPHQEDQAADGQQGDGDGLGNRGIRDFGN